MKKLFSLFIALMLGFPVMAQQFDLGLELRPRYEFRNGYKSLLSEPQDPASVVTQRSRLNFDYKHEKLEAKVSVQNIRAWGDVPTLNTSDENGIAIFEAYGIYRPTETIGFKVGRQVISYDNERMFGEVNWTQQARSHDALVFMFTPAANQQLHIGAAINNEGETLVDVPYTLNNYKNMQYARYHLNWQKSALSLLVLNTGYEYQIGEVDKVQYKVTFGPYFKFNNNGWSGDLSAYGQLGTQQDRDVEAWYAGANLNYSLSKEWGAGIGAEYLSGTDMNQIGGDSNSFNPLFGTNHGFNGFMDYFYVGNHINSVGLADMYAKLTYTKNKLKLTAIPHVFNAAADVYDASGKKQDSYLGTEVDLMLGYSLYKDLSLGMGYSHMFADDSLEVLKGGDAGEIQNWAWVSLTFKPTLFSWNNNSQPANF
ncbi:alginate export protein [Gillisia sp. Hel_I_86]|uniref:alginate export family protein n=1 Tax=Gillisia sp. Hel_I_86 TaxID=1249981 RepID=UPI00119A424C|nr:alginate export family protein [Gillisia sp. Hel_I_86]TVZ27189.1 alginate export protein [Gillisia sp. Hel_I_86]